MAHDPKDDAKANDNNNNGRIVILTGATGEIGGAIAEGVLDSDTNIELHLLVRNEKKAKETLASLKKSSKNLKNSKNSNCTVNYHIVDLSSRTDINKFISLWDKRENNKLDVLINNAAIVPNEYLISKDTNEELQFSVNIMSYFRLANGLNKYLLKSKHENGARIVNVASQYSEQPSYINVNGKKQLNYTTKDRYSSNGAYRQSKAADRMLTHKMAQLWGKSNIFAYSCHPGVTTSNLLKGLGFGHGYDSPAKSASTPIYLAMSSDVSKKDSGKFFSSKKVRSCDYCKNQNKVDELWEFCQSAM